MKTNCAKATVVLIALLVAGCGRKTEVPPTTKLTPVALPVYTVERKTRVATEDVVGTVRAKLRAVIEAKVSGRIDQMLVAPGREVKSGELLAQIDAREIQARLDQATAARDQANIDLERARKLLEDKTVSRQDFDHALARQKIAVATAAEAETMLGYMRVTAPFQGTITRKLADVGDLAAPGRPLLELEDFQSLRLEADVPEALIGSVRLGDVMGVRVAAQTNELRGTVSEIAPVGDPASRTFLVKLDLVSGAGVRAGQFGRVTIPVGERAVLRVPASAIIARGQMDTVFVVADGRAQLRLVKTGRRIGGEVELVSGVEAGEQVVAQGASTLRDGQSVTASAGIIRSLP